MRERQKNQIQNRIRQLDKVHKEIKRRLEECDTDRVKELLEQCQQSAVILGQTIEVAENTGCIGILRHSGGRHGTGKDHSDYQCAV